MRSSLSSIAHHSREPDPKHAREAARAAWHHSGLILINLEWLPSWVDQQQAILLAEQLHGKRKAGQ